MTQCDKAFLQSDWTTSFASWNDESRTAMEWSEPRELRIRGSHGVWFGSVNEKCFDDHEELMERQRITR